MLHHSQPSQSTQVDDDVTPPVTTSCTNALTSNSSAVLLGTGQAEVRDGFGVKA